MKIFDGSMRYVFVRNMFLFVIILSLLERSGASVVSLLIPGKAKTVEIINYDPENNSKEAEGKEVSAKELFNIIVECNAIKPVCKHLLNEYRHSDQNRINVFFPAVPTPPPNLSV